MPPAPPFALAHPLAPWVRWVPARLFPAHSLILTLQTGQAVLTAPAAHFFCRNSGGASLITVLQQRHQIGIVHKVQKVCS